MKTNFLKTLNSFTKTSKNFIVKHSPEILTVVGSVGIISGTVMACKATLKVEEVIEEHSAVIDEIHEECENGIIEEKEASKALTATYGHTALNLVKLYAPSVLVGGVSMAAMISSNHILKKRNVALAAAYSTLDTAFKGYRSRVAKRFGEEVEKEIRYNIQEEEIEEKTTDKKGKEVVKKKKIKNAKNPNEYSEFSKVFDEYNPYWEKDAQYNKDFLIRRQNYANDLLRANKIVFLNEVYELLGFEPTKAGQVIGWVYSKDEDHTGDNYIDFGIFTHDDRERTAAFINGDERSILLDFNVDGEVWSKMKG